ncbi:hypothetical protein [Haladaptatus sp. CMSO5]|uniref:hypothetical protein n=1 Tax=Haladaptatus sp. CMSO5 TaxID=3120514 RepID=UPI002FCE0788
MSEQNVATGVASIDNADDITGRILKYVVGMLLGVPIFALLMALFTSLTLIGLNVNLNPTIATYAVFALTGWGVYFSQELVFGENSEAPEMGKIQSLLATVFAIAYYNAVLFVALLIATVIGSSGFVMGAYIVAMLYPVYDLKMGEHLIPLSVGGFMAFTLYIAYRLVRYIEDAGHSVGAIERIVLWSRESMAVFEDFIFRVVGQQGRPRVR